MSSTRTRDVDYTRYPGRCERLAGAFIAWDAHLGTHYCPTAANGAGCETGDALLSRLHAAMFAFLPQERREALKAVRSFDWPDDPYSLSAGWDE